MASDFFLVGDEGHRTFNDIVSWKKWCEEPESDIARFGQVDEWRDRRHDDPRAFDLERLDHLKHFYVNPRKLDEYRADIVEILELNYASDGVRDPIAVSSPGGADGKTIFVARILRDYTRYVRARGRSEPVRKGYRDRHEPVVFLTQSDDTRTNRFDERIITAYGEKIPSGPLGRLSVKVRELVHDCETSVIVVDDVHLLRDWTGNDLQLLNHLKMLMSDLGVTFVIIGVDLLGNKILGEGDDGYLYLTDPERAIASSTEGRFSHFALPRYGIRTKQQRREFTAIVVLFLRQIPLLRQSPEALVGELTTEEMIDFFYEHSAGALQPLRQLIVRGAWRAIRTGTERLDRKALEPVRVSIGAEQARDAARALVERVKRDGVDERREQEKQMRKRKRAIARDEAAVAAFADRATP